MKSRLFFITYIGANASLILYGLLALFQPEILLEPFQSNVFQFPPEATNAINYLSGLYMLIGYFNIIPGVLGLLILHRYWFTRRKWYLKIAIVSTVLAFLGPITFDNTVGTIGFFEILEHILFLLILISGSMMLKHEDRNTPNDELSSDLNSMVGRQLK